jgi:hypothetical protein
MDLTDMIKEGVGEKEDLNCVENILQGNTKVP